MSIKTLRKRIALVAVSALGAGLMSVVAAPVASANTALVITAPAASRTGVAATMSLLGSTIGGAPLSDGQAGVVKIVPGTLVQPSGGGFSENAALDATRTSNAAGTYPYLTQLDLDITTSQLGAAGSYSMRLYADLDADGLVDSNEPTGNVSWITGGAPTQLIASQSKVSANVGELVDITLTVLDASNRRTLLVSGSNQPDTNAVENLVSETAFLVNINASATAQAILATLGGNPATVATTIHTVAAVGDATADANGVVEVDSTGFSSGTTYAMGEGGAVDATAGTSAGDQDLAGIYIPTIGAYRFQVNMTSASGTVTVVAKFGTTDSSAVYTNVATATTLTIQRATVTTPADAESLGISATQTLTDATASTVATTATASLTTVKTASLAVDVAQPTVNFTLSKSGSTATFGIFVYRNASGADGTGNVATMTASTVNVIPTADLTQGFQRVTLVDGSATFAVTNLTPAAGEKYSVLLVKDARTPGTGVDNAYALINVTYAAPLVNTTNSLISPASAVRKYGESTTMTVKVRDQFDNGIANRVISYTVSGRNPVTTAVQATTNANGDAVITLNDTAASTSTSLTDTVTVDLWPLVAPSTYTETLIITYNSVGSVVAAVTLTDNVSGDSTIEYDAAPYNGTSAVTLTATVLDANGLGLPGVPVTVALPADVKLIPAQSASGSTDASGQYTVGVYSNATGTKSFTASAGGKTSSANLQKWVQGSTAIAIAQKARFLTLSSDQATTKSEGIIQFVAKATDLYGNTVAGVQLRLAENGVGRFLVQTGSNSAQDLFTDSSGTVTVDLTSTAGESGTNTITASFTGNYSNAGTAAAITSPVGDFNSLAGFVGTAPVTGAAAGVEKTTQTATFSGGTVGVSNAEVLASIVKLIAAINKQIRALQKQLRR